VTRLIIEFSASRRGGTVIDGGGDGSNSEDTDAEDALIIKVAVFISDDVANVARDNTLAWAGVRHPSFGGEVGDFCGGGWLCWEWRGLGHGGGEKERGVKDCHVAWGGREEEGLT
jgi:hypothetical protein